MKQASACNRDEDHYPEFSASIQERFNAVVGSGSPLFATDAANLFDIFLSHLPAEARQHYTCNACRQFVTRYGSLAAIRDSGETIPVLWSESGTPEFFLPAVTAMQKLVLKSKVTGVFLSDRPVLGQPVTGEWHHMAITLPRGMVRRSSVKTTGQEMAEKHEDYRILNAALQEYSVAVADQAVILLKSESLYRSDRVLGVAEWFQKLKRQLEATKDHNKQANIKWLAAAGAPAGFCHVKSSMIGTLLDDLAAGLSVEAVGARFAEKMAPGNYMRSQVAPTQGNIQQAERLVEQLGIANSLRRRYARFEEIPHFLWQDRRAARKAAEPKATGVFANITPKEAPATDPGMALPGAVMTWEKFQRTVLPRAESIEARVTSPDRFMAIVTAADPTAPNILQWDNPFSWYYHGGIDGEIRRRVERAGGRYENNEIRCSLIWEGYTDLDLHCGTPHGQHIYWRQKRIVDGWLDVDANGGSPTTLEPVENIRWGQGCAPTGRYVFYVHNFCERGKGQTPFKVELEVGGKVYTFRGVAGTTGYQTNVFAFNHIKGQHPSIESFGNDATDDAWGIAAGGFVKVTGVVESPNQWGEAKALYSGQHVFFLMDGCRDKSEGKGRGFFNEMLKPDLREIRKTLEAYTANTPIEDAESASACGLGYAKDNEWGLTLKVTANNSTHLITIDRWD